MSQRKQVRDPMKTKTGKIRLGGLTVTQLTAMVDKEGRKKIRARILNRIRIVQSRKGSVEKVVAESAE
jgi:hypothetical protein